MKISIAMATYNGAEHLQEQRDSFRRQYVLPDELVVCDDGSSDRTPDLLEAFAEDAPFEVRVHNNDRTLGYSQNFNRALQLTTGDIVFPSDQDDVWYPTKIGRLTDLARQRPQVQVFMCNAHIVDSQLSPTGLTKLGQIRSAGLGERDFVMGCCMAVRSTLLRHILPVPPAYPAHDSWIVAFADGLHSRHIESEPLQAYRRHSANVSGFAANSPLKVGAIRYALSRLRSNAAGGYVEKLCRARLQTRLVEERATAMLKSSELEPAFRRHISAFVDDLEALATFQETRIELLTRRRVRRVMGVLRMLARGDYTHANGLRTALQDCLLSAEARPEPRPSSLA